MHYRGECQETRKVPYTNSHRVAVDWAAHGAVAVVQDQGDEQVYANPRARGQHEQLVAQIETYQGSGKHFSFSPGELCPVRCSCQTRVTHRDKSFPLLPQTLNLKLLVSEDVGVDNALSQSQYILSADGVKNDLLLDVEDHVCEGHCGVNEYYYNGQTPVRISLPHHGVETSADIDDSDSEDNHAQAFTQEIPGPEPVGTDEKLCSQQTDDSDCQANICEEACECAQSCARSDAHNNGNDA